MASKIEIVQRAAFNTGNGWITSLDAIDEVSQGAAANYEAILESMLTQHAWKFARRAAPINKLTAVPETPWTALYQAPVGMLSLEYVVDTDTGTRVEHEERDLPSGRAIAVLDTHNNLTAVYTYRVAEDRFPADFAMALQYRMEAIFLSGIAEQRQEAAGREKMAALYEQKARVRDQRSSTATNADEWDLTAARRLKWPYVRGIRARA
jgi:hypothetical protein